MANRYAVNSGLWSDTSSVWSDTDGGLPGNFVPVDGDTVYISAGATVVMDVDQSAFAGLLGLTIRGGSTPGTLVFKNGTSGHLKLRTGADLVGTTDTNKGRLLINSDGVWGNTGVLAFANKAIIDFNGTAKMDATHLDLSIHCTEPDVKYVRTYGSLKTVSSVNAGTDTITMDSAHGWAANTPIMFKSTGDLPAPLEEDRLYFVKNPNGADLQLAPSINGATLDITSAGSGTIQIYDGQASGGNTINVFEDVTGEAEWITTDGHNFAVLVNGQIGNADFQVLQITNIASGSMTLSTTIDSDQYPGARIFLLSRNISIRSSQTAAQSIVQYPTNGVIKCDIRNTAANPSNPAYGYGIYEAKGCEIGGALGSLNWSFSKLYNCDFSGVVCGTNGLGSDTSSSRIGGILAGSVYSISGGWTSCVISAEFFGCSYISFGEGHGSLFTGRIHKCGSLVNGECIGSVFTNVQEISRQIIYTFTCNDITLRNARFFEEPTTLYRNYDNHSGRLRLENVECVAGTHKIIDCFGDIVKTACDGTGDAPSADPDGGHGYCIEASNIQSLCSVRNRLRVLDGYRVWVAAGAHTFAFKLQTTYSGLTAGDLELRVQYVGAGGHIQEVTAAPAVSQRTGASDWTQTISVSFTSTQDGWVTSYMELKKYEAGNEIYVWPVPVVS